MKTVLQDKKSELFFRNMDQWTSTIDEAAGFRDIPAALKFCQRNNLSDVAVVHIYGGGVKNRIVGFHRARPTPSNPSAEQTLS